MPNFDLYVRSREVYQEMEDATADSKCYFAPTLEQLRLLLAHLPEGERKQLNAEVRRGNTIYVAAPPHRVASAAQILQLSFLGGVLVVKRFSVESEPHELYRSFEDARLFAHRQWPECMYTDGAVDYIQFNLCDNRVRHIDGVLVPLCTVGALLTRSVRELLRDRSKPSSEVIADSVVALTSRPWELDEFRTVGRKERTEFMTLWNCGICGGGLLADRCSVCDSRLVDATSTPTGNRAENTLPLPWIAAALVGESKRPWQKEMISCRAQEREREWFVRGLVTAE